MPGLGRLPSEDVRDLNFRLAALLPSEPSRRYRYYWSGFFGDQGRYPHCVGFSWMHWLVSGPTTQKARDWPAQARGTYFAAQLLDEWPGTDYDGTSVRAGAKSLQQQGYVASYRWAFSGDEVVRAVLDVGPVVVGTNWYQSMFFPSDRGLIIPDGPVVGGHAYLIDGASLNSGKVRIKNSWGRDWGVYGRAWMTIGDLSRLMAEDGEATLAFESRPVG